METKEFLESIKTARNEMAYRKALITGAMDAIRRCLKETHDHETFVVLMMMCQYIGGKQFEFEVFAENEEEKKIAEKLDHLLKTKPDGYYTAKLEAAIFGDENDK